MELKRRDFLKVVSWTLAALGISEVGWLRVGGSKALALAAERYYQAVAQPTSRKLALLIGINQYPQIPALNGCLTDVELQRELLIHRFGFKEGDILTLSDQQATRQQIETAFLQHLCEQAQPDDVVVFHFSGYGRSVQLQASSKNVASSLVPVDVGATSEHSVVNDLLEETLWLLLRSLPTNLVTTILDTSYSSASTGFRGNLRIRSRPQVIQGQVSPEELEFQQQLRSTDAIVSQKPIPGVILAAAGSTQSAAEMQWTGFSAGLFTYALTRCIWEVTQPMTFQVSLSQVAGFVQQIAGKEQQPQLSTQKNQAQSESYYLVPDSSGAAGVVKFLEDDGKTVQLWLAGLPPTVLEYLAANSRLTVVNSLEGKLPLQLQLRSRTGLKAKARLSSKDSTDSLKIGQLVQESIRVLPRQIGLLVALETGLERIERVDTTSAFASISRSSLVTVGEPADCLFGRVREAKSTTRYGLFSVGQELIPDTAGAVGEAIKVAVNRLVPRLQTLLAVKLWRLTENEGSSRLGVQATLEITTTTERILVQREAQRSPILAVALEHSTLNIPTVPIGSRIQYRVHNYSTRPVYLMLLGLDSSKSAIALYPTEPNSDDIINTKPLLKDVVIAPGETLTVPRTSVDSDWVIHGPTALSETQLIFSSAPFTQAFVALEAAMPAQGEQKQIGALLNPLEVAQAVLQDLHNASAITAEMINPTPDTYALDVNAWASLSFVYEIV